jgi:CBS domain-containing protein/sporulation protein YlmC with PRC-barrel domain
MYPRNPTASLSFLLRTRVLSADGEHAGRIYDIAVGTGADAGRVAGIVVKSRAGLGWLSATAMTEQPDGAMRLVEGARLEPMRGDESFVLLRQDLLDRQIIDVHGRKVVRVNDVDLRWFGEPGQPPDLRVSEVEVGLRGAARRLLLDLLPHSAIAAVTSRIAARVIPWDFVDLIEADPARRVKLKMSSERLAQLHPSDIAEILEDLAQAEREAIFASLDQGVAAHALEEADPALQKSLIESMDVERTAGIVEEMDPEAAADMLAELLPEHSESILGEMGEEERLEVEELLEFREDSAAGRMTTDYVQVAQTSTVADAVQALREFGGAPETVTEIYLVEDASPAASAGLPWASPHAGKSPILKGVVPLARLLLAEPGTRLDTLADRRFACINQDAHQRHVAELFDKYNLRALPVVNEHGALVGVVEADHVIAFLRDAK